jgi:D-alanyl-D-alanine carboxypeptidase
LGLAAVAAAVTFSSNPANARYHRAYVRHVAVRHVAYFRRHIHAEGYTPPGASIVVDGNTGSVLYAANADGLRHPASLTKIMTLYLLFERLDAGRIRLDSQLKVSEHSSEQAPTKLGLRPGQTIAVEDAIKAVVTKSANDAAVTIAENLGGDEDSFAKMMTEKAHALGMSRTTYVNASGLPDDDQITSAQDQALLGRAIQERFPRYYKFFATPAFTYHGHAMRNHNHLLGVVGGVDGIKTGYTRASGFNLVTSVHRDGRYIIAVVLGGRSAGERDAHMRELINEHIREASLRHTAPAIAESEPRSELRTAIAERVEPREAKLESRPQSKPELKAAASEARPVAFAKAPMAARVDAAPTTASVNAASANAKPGDSPKTGSNDPIQPVMVKTVSYRTAPVQTAAMAPMPALVPTPAPLPLPQPPARAQTVAAAPPPPAVAPVETPSTVVVASADPAPIAISAKSEIIRIDPPRAEIIARTEPIRVEPIRAEPVRAEAAKAEPSSAQIRARGGWLIQIGAYEGEDEAKQKLNVAKLKVPAMLGSADPFTEKVQKGEKALYRARFAGFDKIKAEAACRQLKRSDIACMTVKD